MNYPKISIITPTYNSAKHLNACLLSVAQQSYVHKEHLIIDNLSTDETVAIVKTYALQYPHIRIISEQDIGIYDAMNKGIDKSTGDWLYFLGSDDTLFDNDVLTELIGSDESAHYDILYGNVQWGTNGPVYDGEFSFVKLFEQNICHQAIFFRRNIFNRFGKFDVKYKVLSDWAFNLLWFGNEEIRRAYHDRIIAVYNPFGYSSIEQDPLFHAGKRDIIGQHYPQVFVQLFDQCVKNKKLSHSLEECDQQIGSLTQEINSLTQEVSERDQKINKMLNSSSWRMTKPIRNITHSVRKRSRKIKAFVSGKHIASFNGMEREGQGHSGNSKGNGSTGYPAVNDYEKDLVTIAIISKNRYDFIRPCIESIENHRGNRKIEILIGDTGTKEKRVLNFYREAEKNFDNIRVVSFKEYFFSQKYNDLIFSYANGEYLVLLNNDTIAKPGWLDALIAPLEDKRVGIVGAKLLSRDGTIQHAGIEYNDISNGCHRFLNEASIIPGVTFTCVAMRHDVYDRFQSSEEFREKDQDTDFCQRLSSAGFAIIYEPKAELLLFEEPTRDCRNGESDSVLLNEKWGTQIRKLSLSEKQSIPFDADAYRDAIVVIRDDGIGDLLMGISAFRKLRKKYPSRKLVLMTYERNIAMMEGFGIFDEILPIPNEKKYSPLPVPSKNTTLYNLIDLEMLFGGTIAKSRQDNKVHRHVAFTRKFGLDDRYAVERMPEYPDAKESIHKILHEMGGLEQSRYVVLNLMASNPARSWWEPYYPMLIKAVEQMGFVPIFIGTKQSSYLQGNNAINLIGKTRTIPEYIEALKLGKYVISTDTSACHIAALSGIPFLAIFTGGVLAEARLSYYEHYEVIEPKGLDCYPCWDVGCKDHSVRWKKDPCRLMLTPEEVIAKFKTLVKKYPYM